MLKRANSPLLLGRPNVLAIGFGAHNAWIYSTLYSTFSGVGANTVLPGIHGSSLSLVYVISAIVFGSCLLFTAATDQKYLRFYVSRGALRIGALLTCAGTLILVLPIDAYPVALALEIMSGIATGSGSAILLLSWGITFARSGATSALFNGTLSVIAGLMVNAFLLHRLPFPFGGLITAGIPLIEWFILSKVFPRPFAEVGDAPYFLSFPSNKAGFACRLGASMFVLGLALGILRQASVQTMVSNVTDVAQVVMLLFAGCLSLVILAVLFATQDPDKWDCFFRLRAPAIVVSALVLSLVVNGSAIFTDYFLLISHMCFEALMWVYLCQLSRRFRLSPILIFGLCRGALTLAALVGVTLPTLVSPWFDHAVFGNSNLLTALLVVTGYVLMLSEQRIESLVIRCPLTRIVSIGLHEGIDLLEIYRNSASRARQDEERQTDTSPPQRKVGRFSRKVNQVAKTYLLTNRETDVLFELAKGHRASYIQEKYFISEGTVKTHIKNIYHKLNVHKHEALMRLINEVDEGRYEG